MTTQIVNFKFLRKIGNKLRVTKKYGSVAEKLNDVTNGVGRTSKITDETVIKAREAEIKAMEANPAWSNISAASIDERLRNDSFVRFATIRETTF